MTIAWMTYTLLTGALVAVAALSAEWSLRSAKRAVRFVWLGAMAITVAFAMAAPLRVSTAATGEVSTASLPASGTAIAVAPTLLQRALTVGASAVHVLAQPAQALLRVAGHTSPALNRGAAIVWAATAFLVLVLLGAVYGRSTSERLRWPVMQVLGRRVRVAPDAGPAVMGVAPAEIVIPQWVLARAVDEQELVLAHEEAHVRAHDPLVLLVACILLAFMPWNVTLWYMWSRLRLAVEVDCDQRVLQRVMPLGIRKPAYGELLVALAGQRPWMSPVMPAFSWGTTHLEQRLLAMTARPARFVRFRRAASCCVIGGTLLAACQSEMPTSAQIDAMDATTLAARVPLMRKDSVVYIVDGKQMAEAEAKAIASGDITSVEIVKGRTASQVRIKLRGDSLEPQTTGDGAGKHEQRIAGVPATTEPMQGARIRLRGQPCTATDKSSCEPLVIVDGVVVAGGMAGINPNTIESVEVIKGAAAARLYGERGANGVISIRIKK